MYAPWFRPGLVQRSALVERLVASSEPIVAVVAPAGYGKTTVLSQWVERTNGQSAWLTLDRRDNDPAVLVGYVAAALDRVEPIDARVRRSLLSPGVATTAHALPLLASLMSSRRRSSMLVLDNVEVIDNQRSLDVITQLGSFLASGSRLAVASRVEPPLPMARLRAHGQVLEIGVDQLRMDDVEAAELLHGAGADIDAAARFELLSRTEGWPVGIYLAAFVLNAVGRRHVSGPLVTGDDRAMADYLRSEVLDQLPAETAAFLRRTSMLERLSGPLCDAVLGTTDSRVMLDSLERSNLLLVPLDRRREWYRYHRLFRDLLQAELARDEAGLVDELHDRAAAWLEANGLPALAIDHAQAAGNADLAARLFTTLAQPTYASGQLDTAMRWRRWFSAHGLDRSYPRVGVLGGLADALVGRADGAEQTVDSVGSSIGEASDGWDAVLDAALCEHGVERMRQDAARATRQLARDSPLLGPAMFFAGVSTLLLDDLEAADVLLEQAVDACLRRGGTPTAAAALAERAVIAIVQQRDADAVTLAARATAAIRDGNCEDYLTSVVVHAVGAQVAISHADVDRARVAISHAVRLRPLCTAAFPVSAQFLVELARAQAAVGDTEGGRSVLRQVTDILGRRPGLGVVARQVADVRGVLDSIRARAGSAHALTVAELRVLPYLATHFTFREIGQRLYVSPNTVKSQAMSIYRKLGVTSRGEAVEAARTVGILAS